MSRNRGIVVGLALLVLALVGWRWHSSGDRAASATGHTAATPGTTTQAGATAQAPRPDPAKLVRGAIRGTVTDETTAPITGAHVCVAGASGDLDSELLREPTCATTDDHGGYAITNLLPARYTVSAAAKPFRPGVYHPGGDRKRSELSLAAGQQVTGIDIQLRAGGVEITGVVSDLTGGPIEKARVSAGGSPWNGTPGTAITETAADGTFALWVSPGNISITAAAEGYADGWSWTYAPGKVELLLTPESTLSGIVIDATSSEPIAGARVAIGGSEWGGGNSSTFSDAKGAFRVARLTPGRYVAVARTDHGYGRAEGSTLVGLGQQVDGVIVKLHPAVRFEGTVVISTTKQPCTAPDVSLNDATKSRWAAVHAEPDGRVWAEGVLPGTYSVDVDCDGYQSREKYDPIVIADNDITGVVFEVDPGAKIAGRVLGKTGAPVPDARVSARTVGGAARGKGGWASDRTQADGRYLLDGLRPGTYKLDVESDQAVAPKDGFKIEVAAGAAIEKDLVLEDAGTIKGVVVDSEGKPVAAIETMARPLTGTWGAWGNDHKTDDTGAFTIDSLRPGDYRVVAQHSWANQLRKPGTTDDAEQGERVTVRANQVVTVKLVVEAQTGTISGVVTDAAGQPVADAFISSARESDAAGAQKTNVRQTRWSWDDKPVITGLDGSFALARLAPGAYTVRAYRKGGGEAVAEHVRTGGTATLQIKSTGSITGVAHRGGGVPEELSLTVRDLVTGFWRREQYFRTAGRFTIDDLPQGHFQISASAEGGQSQVDLDLAEGERKTGVTIELADLVTLTGRIVDQAATKPVPGIRMMARPMMGGGGMSFSSSDDRDNITDDAGRFTIKNAPRGKVMLRGFPRDWNDSDYGGVNLIRTVEGTGTVDLGDLPILRNRVKNSDPAGKLGVNFAESPPATPPDERKLEVSFIDPTGPAAKTELEVGDVITTIDGTDVTGPNGLQAAQLMRAPPGTKLVFGLARGATVTVVLAAP